MTAPAILGIVVAVAVVGAAIAVSVRGNGAGRAGNRERDLTDEERRIAGETKDVRIP